MLELLEKNKEWFFSGAGITITLTTLTIVATIVAYFVNRSRKAEGNNIQQQTPSVSQNVTQNVYVGDREPIGGSKHTTAQAAPDRELVMQNTRILFVDDQTDFPVVKIIQKAGWKNVAIKKDIANFSTAEIRAIDVFFVDIQGVGKSLEFTDEGLGLAKALKNHFGKNKKVIIYSAEPRGETFHDAWGVTDGRLRKNAEPYEYLQLLDQLTGLTNV
ncbi:hypothetical protein [Paraburkholderia unamae]|uniref:Uncharacterized protein n=1 Tax=Paraburkholderia unamae TaxID=219649 RepID=A0ACC6RQ29_9BURK